MVVPETFPQRLARIAKFYLLWCVLPWVGIVTLALVADAIWRLFYQ